MVFDTLVYTTRNEEKVEYMMRVRWTDVGGQCELKFGPGSPAALGAALTVYIETMEDDNANT